jgi:hypothetical protein
LKGTSSWINFFLDRDSRPGHAKDSVSSPVPAVEAVDSKNKVAVQ